MLKRIINWFLYTFHLRKRTPGKSGLQSLLDLVPAIFAIGLIVGIVKYLDLPKPTWYGTLLFRIKWHFRKLRWIVIGY